MLGVINWTQVAQSTASVSNAVQGGTKVYNDINALNPLKVNNDISKLLPSNNNLPSVNNKDYTTTYLIVGGVAVVAVVGILLLIKKKRG